MKLCESINEQLNMSEADEPKVSGKAKYNITFETWTPEDIEHGDTDDKGFEDEDVKIEDFDDLESVVKDMNQLEDGNWSNGRMKAKDLMKGNGWWSGKYDEDNSTGAVTNRGYHFEKLSEEEAEYILKNVK